MSTEPATPDRPAVTLTLDNEGKVVIAGTAVSAMALGMARGSIGGTWDSEEEILAHYGVDRPTLDVLSALHNEIADLYS